MMLSVLLATSLALQEQQPIQFRADGERLDTVVARLAEVTGQSLEVGSEGRSHYLVIRAEDSTAEQLMEGIAAATTSKWEESGFGLRLNPDTEKRRELKEAEEAELVAKIEAGIAKWISDLETAKEKAAEQPFYWTNSISPALAMDMVSKLLPLIDPQYMVRARRSGRVVFSTSPTPMQNRFVDAPASLMPDLRRSYNEFLDWYFEDEERTTQAARNAYQIEQSRYSKYFVWPAQDVSLDKVNLAIFWFGDLGTSPTISIDLQGYNMSSSEPRQIFEHKLYSSPLTIHDEEGDMPGLINHEAQLEFGQELGEILAFRPVHSYTQFSELPDSYRQMMLNPERFDPQELVVPPVIDSLFGHLEGDLIAMVPDHTAWFPLSPFLRDELKTMLVSNLDRNYRYVRIDQIHVIAPRDVGFAAACTVDRAVLGRFVRDYVGYVALPIRVLAEFLDSIGNSLRDYSGTTTLRVVLGQHAFNNLMVAELLSHCDSFQIDLLLNGVEGRLNNLAPGFTQRVQGLVYGSQWRIRLNELAGERVYEDVFASQVMDSNHPVARRTLEPTELLPNGIPRTSQIRTNSYDALGVATFAGESGPMRGVTVSSEYMFAYMQATRAMSQPRGQDSGLSKYRFGEMTITEIMIQLTDELGISFLVEDTTITLDSPEYAESDFPESLRERIAKARSAMAAHDQLGFLFDPRYGAPPIRPSLFNLVSPDWFHSSNQYGPHGPTP